MLLRNAMRRPRAVEYGSLSWEDLNRQFRKIFLSGGPYDTGIRGAERLIRGHKMLHIHNTCARWCFGNARCYVDANENQKLMKDRSIGRIDIVVAWVISLATAIIMRGQKDYDTRHLREDWGL